VKKVFSIGGMFVRMKGPGPKGGGIKERIMINVMRTNCITERTK